MRIADIKIGDRHRKDMGDIKGLANSIGVVGLLHPVVVDNDGTLIAGLRRLRAFELLGRTEIPATVVDLEEIILGESDENVCRKNFTPSEYVAISRAIEPLEREEAEKRRERRPISSGNLPGQIRSDSRDKIAKALGVSGRTFEKAKEIIAAAESEPEKYAPLADEMDRTGRVAGVHRKLNVAKKSEAIEREAPTLPAGKYHVIVADPPWKYPGEDAVGRRAPNPYPSMSMDEIRTLDVARLALDNCILWLWTTNTFMRDAFTVLDAWGFEHRTILTWGKNKFGLGDWLRGQTEHCIMAIKGRPTVRLTNESTLLLAPTGKHSEKPEAFYEMVERMCPGRKVELFQRQPREGWDGFGDEVEAGVFEGASRREAG